MAIFIDVFEDVTRLGKKIPTSEYLESGKYPIIDQGQSNIAGYTNEENGLFTDVPVVIFGDHTRAVKYVDTPFFLGADGVKVLKSKIRDMNYKYLYYAVSSVNIPDTGYNRHFKWLKEADIQIPSLKIQYEIVKNLDSLTNLIDLHNQQLKKLDELVKSRFVELFVGKDYPLIELDDLSIGKGEYGAQSASVEYNDSRPRYVRITDINDDGTLNNDVVSSANTEDDVQYKLSYGDFLFARMGATVGKTYAYKTGNQIFAGYLIRYRLNFEKIMPEYLYSYTKLDEYKTWVLLNQSGAAQPGINAKKYGSLQIPVAPLDEQKRFVSFIKQIDKSKFEVQQSLEKLETLKKSLMQQYFG